MSSFTEGPLEYRPIRKSKWSKRTIYEITKPFRYRVGSYDSPFFIVEIPKGFHTDLASVPWPLHKVIRQDGPYAKAACVHDYLLKQIAKDKVDLHKYYVTRLIIDSIFYEAMIVSKVSKIIAWPFYISVRLLTIIGYGWGLIPKRLRGSNG